MPKAHRFRVSSGGRRTAPRALRRMRGFISPTTRSISREDQAQIYEELISSPADVAAPVCGPGSKPGGRLTTSFLSGCTKVKDNRMLPHGFLKLQERIAISRALGADVRLAEESGSTAIGNDADYETGGGDSLIYRVPVSQLAKRPATVKATLYYQAAPPYYLQDRFLHVQQRRYQASGLSDRKAQPGWHAGGRMEAAAGRQRPGSGALVQQRRRGTAEDLNATCCRADPATTPLCGDLVVFPQQVGSLTSLILPQARRRRKRKIAALAVPLMSSQHVGPRSSTETARPKDFCIAHSKFQEAPGCSSATSFPYPRICGLLTLPL